MKLFISLKSYFLRLEFLGTNVKVILAQVASTLGSLVPYTLRIIKSILKETTNIHEILANDICACGDIGK